MNAPNWHNRITKLDTRTSLTAAGTSKKLHRVLFLPDCVEVTTPVSLFEGYSIQPCADEQCRGTELIVAMSRERIMRVFSDAIEGMEGEIGLKFKRSLHTYQREEMDRVVFASTIWDFTDVVEQDGRSGLQVFDCNGTALELGHEKMLIIHTIERQSLEWFKELLHGHGIYHGQGMKTIGNHGRKISTTPQLGEQFMKMIDCLDMIDKDSNDGDSWKNEAGVPA